MHDLTYLSLGAGVQSTALLIMSALGLHGCPKADVAIFADTGDEPAWVYEHLWRLAEWSEIPVEIVRYGTLSEDILGKRSGRRARVPFFVQNADGSRGMVRRQCTTAYKVEPIERRVRELLGLRKGQRAAERFSVDCLIGISLDECDRMRTNPTQWITNLYPLVDARLKRQDCERIALKALGYVPEKSSCVFCPFHSDAFWRRLKREAPAEFERACQFDERVRAQETNIHSPVYVHGSLRPLREVDFGDSQRELFREDCSGVCGV